MLEEDGIVVSVLEGMAEVRVTPKSACGSCSARSGCGTSLIASLFPERSSRFKVRNTLGAVTGEQVVIGLHESALQSASLMLYLIPLAGLILGAVSGVYLTERIFHSPSELLTILFGFGGMGAGFALIKYLSQHARSLGHYQAEIIRINKAEAILKLKEKA